VLQRPLGSIFFCFGRIKILRIHYQAREYFLQIKYSVTRYNYLHFGRDEALWVLSTVYRRLGQKPVRDSCDSSEMLRAPSWASGVVSRVGGIWKLKSSTTVGGWDLFLFRKARRNRVGKT
jgi:hypothetical protein